MTGSRALRLWHTARHLKPVQVYGRLWFRLHVPRPDLSPAPGLRAIPGPWQHPAARRPSLSGPHSFLFLGQTGSLDEIGWDGPAREKLWRYNQHYFDDLTALGPTAWHGIPDCWRIGWRRTRPAPAPDGSHTPPRFAS